MNYDLDSINPDTLGKDELVEWLTKLTSGSPEQWRQEPVRSLRAELAAASKRRGTHAVLSRRPRPSPWSSRPPASTPS